jgi:methionyl-tRNA formyltransferase
LRVAFAGTPEFALPPLEALGEHHEVVGVLTRPDRPQGRGRKLGVSPVKAAALARHLPLDQPPTLKSAAGRAALTQWAPEVLIVVAYGLLLPPEVLLLPRYGCLNLHASLLPRWRGAAPIQRAILAGDQHTGVTIMQMDEGLDTGPLLASVPLVISAAHTAGSLHDELSIIGAEALLEALTGLARGTLTATPQPAEGVSYAGKIDKAEARIDWARDALEIERQVRAFNPWPVAETLLDGQQLRIHSARTSPIIGEDNAKSTQPGTILKVEDDFFAVRCGVGVLQVTQVQQPGRNPVGARDFSHSHALKGRRLG